MNDDKERDPKTDPVIPESERELDIRETGDEPKTTKERNEDSEKTQDQEVNQNVSNDNK